jgi:cysteine desulfurase
MPCSNIYFDYNSSAPLTKGAKQAIIEMLDQFGNPSSVHYHGRMMRRLVEDARDALAQRLKADRSDTIIFNSGCTEGNNTVLKTFASLEGTILTTTIEHACVLNATAQPTLIPTDHNGILDLNMLEQHLKAHASAAAPGPCLVSVMLANNELGTIQPLQEVIHLARQYHAYVHTDAAQALGRIAVDLERYPVDYLALSSQKIGGPTGVGALYIKAKAPYQPLILGSSQEKGRRAGTLNSRFIHAFKAAFAENCPDSWAAADALRNWIEDQILSFCPEARVWAKHAQRLPNTSSLMMPGVANQTQIMAFDLAGYSVSAGSACSSGKLSTSHVLQAIGLTEQEATNTIRLSLCPDVTPEQATGFVAAWKEIYTRASASASTSVATKAPLSQDAPVMQSVAPFADRAVI